MATSVKCYLNVGIINVFVATLKDVSLMSG